MRRNGLWAAIDVSLFRHPKFLACTPPAQLLCIASILYAAEHLTDGTIRKEFLTTNLFPLTKSKKRHVQELVDNRLWDVENHGDNLNGPWQIHDYLDWNPSRKWHQDRRERDRVKKQQFRANMRKNQPPATPMSPRDSMGDSPLGYVTKELNPNSALRDVAVENPHRPEENGSSNPDLTNTVVIRHSGFGMANPEPVERQPEPMVGELESMMRRLQGDVA